MAKEKKTKNYILSNNVVINLQGLLSRRKSSRKPKSPKKEPEEQTEEQTEEQATTAPATSPTRFANVATLDTQIQQANLREAENRFKNTLMPTINRAMTTPNDRIREQQQFYNPNDNAGAFGAIQGSDSFPAQGNNIPIHEQNDEEIEATIPETQFAEEEIPVETPFMQEEAIYKKPLSKKQSRKQKKKRRQEVEEEEQPPLDMSPDIYRQFRATLDIPEQFQPNIKKIMDSKGKKTGIKKAELRDIYTYLTGDDANARRLTIPVLETEIKRIMNERLDQTSQSDIRSFFGNA